MFTLAKYITPASEYILIKIKQLDQKIKQINEDEKERYVDQDACGHEIETEEIKAYQAQRCFRWQQIRLVVSVSGGNRVKFLRLGLVGHFGAMELI